MHFVYIKDIGYGVTVEEPIITPESTLDNLKDSFGNDIKCCPISKEAAIVITTADGYYNLDEVDEMEKSSYVTRLYVEW